MMRIAVATAVGVLGSALVWMRLPATAERPTAPGVARAAGPEPRPALLRAAVLGPVESAGRSPVPELAEAGRPIQLSAAAPDVAAAAGPQDSLAGLYLTLVDRVSGAPVEGSVVIYRFDTPVDLREPGRWALLRAESVGADGIAIEGLRPGFHRLHVASARAGFEDPPAFELRSGVTRMLVPVDRPPCHPVRLLVVDERGQRIDPVSVTWLPTGFASVAPEWSLEWSPESSFESGAQADSAGAGRRRADFGGFDWG
jgi:hypothetical protein